MTLSYLTGWYHPDQVPARRGYYLRDHRKVREYDNPADRRISLDLWEPVPDRRDRLYPGVWYVQDGAPQWRRHPVTGNQYWDDAINDASQQYLPWRGLLEPVE